MDKFENPEGICANPFDIWEVFMCFKIPLKIKFLSLWQKKVKKTNTFQRSRILETHFSDMHPDITRQDVTFSYTPYCFFIISDHYNVTLGKCQKKSKTEMIGFNISQFTEWKKEKFTLMKKKFREINFLTTYLGKTLFSRNFCQKKVTVNFCKFHSVGSCPLFFFFFFCYSTSFICTFIFVCTIFLSLQNIAFHLSLW